MSAIADDEHAATVRARERRRVQERRRAARVDHVELRLGLAPCGQSAAHDRLLRQRFAAARLPDGLPTRLKLPDAPQPLLAPRQHAEVRDRFRVALSEVREVGRARAARDVKRSDGFRRSRGDHKASTR